MSIGSLPEAESSTDVGGAQLVIGRQSFGVGGQERGEASRGFYRVLVLHPSAASFHATLHGTGAIAPTATSAYDADATRPHRNVRTLRPKPWSERQSAQTCQLSRPFVESARRRGAWEATMPGVPMESHGQRWPADMWAAIVLAAKHKGESVSEYVRTAALSRAAYDAARRDDEVSERFDELWPAAGKAGKELHEVYDLDDE